MKKRTKLWLHASLVMLTLSTVGTPLIAVAGTTIAEEQTDESIEESGQTFEHRPFALLEEAAKETEFLFQQARIDGKVGASVLLNVLASKPATEVAIQLPKEAKLVKEELPGGVSAQALDNNQWRFSSSLERSNFSIPVQFDTVGKFEATTESDNKTTVTIEEAQDGGQEGISEEQADLPSKDNDESIEIGARNLNFFENFSLIDADGRIQDPSVLPDDFIILTGIEGEEQKMIHNGVEISHITSLALGIGNSIRITSVGIDRRGQVVDSILTLVSGESRDSHFSMTNGVFSTWGHNSVEFKLEHVYQEDDNPVEVPILKSLLLTNSGSWNLMRDSTTLYTILGDTFANRALTYVESSALQTFAYQSFVTDYRGFNYISSPISMVRFSLFASSRMEMYQQQGVAVDFSYLSPRILGHTSEQQFISQYTIEQDIPNFTDSDFELVLDSSDVSLVEQQNIINIVSEQGNSIRNQVEIEVENQTTKLIFPRELVESLRGTTMTIEISFPIKHTESLQEYLVDDYVEIPLQVYHSHLMSPIVGTAKTWARPWGAPVPQKVSLGHTTNNYNPSDFITNLENMLIGDEPFVVGFSEEKNFDELGDTSVGVVIESEISGIQNTIEVPVTVENKGRVFVHHVDKHGEKLIDSEMMEGRVGEDYTTEPKDINNHRLIDTPENASGVFTEEDINVTYIYEIAPVSPVDPIDPDQEVDPENPPVLPEDQGLISIDFVSQFNFGEVPIQADGGIYEALPQRLLNEDGTVGEEERPNYVQVSDRRAENNGWELTARLSDDGFHTSDGEQLRGVRILLENTEMVTTRANEAVEPFYRTNAILEPGNLRSLAVARNNEGSGTWVQRYGDQETAASSVKLDVPVGANPKAARYEATIEWELSFTPGND